MTEENSNGADELDVLQDVLATLGQRLELIEEWRALRQLDERERNGNPLEGIDGVVFRGRLVQRLAQSSRDWRAYVRIEEAIGHLHGFERLETGILKEPPHFEMGYSVAGAERASGLDASVGSIPQAVSAGIETVEASPVAGNRSGSLDADAKQPRAPILPPAPIWPPETARPEVAEPLTENDAQEGQRLRYKVRAGSLPLPNYPPTPIRSILSVAVPVQIDALPPAAPAFSAIAPGDVPPVASLRPRPPFSQVERIGASASDGSANDPGSPRSVLQRIRVVKRPPQPHSQPQSLAPAVPDALAPLPSSVAIMPVLGNIPTSFAPHKHSAAAATPSASTAAVSDASDVTAATGSDKRFDDLEAELGQLIDRSASWPHPLDAIRATSEPGARSVTERADSAGLEPDTAIELEVDEAEVTIVRIATVDVISTERQPSLLAEAHRPAATTSPRLRAIHVADDEGAPRDEYAGSGLDLEEASVEIIVPEHVVVELGEPAEWGQQSERSGNWPELRPKSRDDTGVRKI